jgi:hypothetical protein
MGGDPLLMEFGGSRDDCKLLVAVEGRKERKKERRRGDGKQDFGLWAPGKIHTGFSVYGHVW